MTLNEILVGDALERLKELPSESANCCVTSPPYWGLRDYGMAGQIGLEATPEEFVARLVEVFREVRRVLRPDGTAWINMGDCYAAGPGGDTGRSGLEGSTESQDEAKKAKGAGPRIGHRSSFRRDRMPRQDHPHKSAPALKPKDLVGQPWRLAFALQADGWWLRSDIIWAKPNPMPESITDRPTKSHEYMFLLAKSERYYYDADAIREVDSGQDNRRSCTEKIDRTQPGVSPHRGLRTLDGRNGKGRNRRTVWTIPTHPFPDAHFAVFPEALVQPCVLAGCPAGGVVLDPFMGSGTTALVALKAGRNFIGIELNPEYVKIAEGRVWQEKHQARLV